MKKLWLLSICSVLVFVACQNPASVEEESFTPAKLNETVLYSGSGESSSYDVSIVFEAKNSNPTKEEYKTIMDALVGNGPFSLFQTIPFRDNKEKFNISYTIISSLGKERRLTRKSDGHVFTTQELADLRVEADKSFQDRGLKIESFADATTIDTALSTDLGLDKTDIESFSYADAFSLSSPDVAQSDKDEITQNLQKFDAVFDKQNNVDLKVYVSSGVEQAYANTSGSGPKSIYMNYHDYIALGGLFVQSSIAFPDYAHKMMATTFSHEFGHAFALFVDEYNGGDPSDMDSRKSAELKGFDNNVVTEGFKSTSINTSFDHSISNTNPWVQNSVPLVTFVNSAIGAKTITYIPGPVPDYTGTLVLGAKGGKGEYRATTNSIMINYLFMNQTEWVDGWNLVQRFYINYFLKQSYP